MTRTSDNKQVSIHVRYQIPFRRGLRTAIPPTAIGCIDCSYMLIFDMLKDLCFGVKHFETVGPFACWFEKNGGVLHRYSLNTLFLFYGSNMACYAKLLRRKQLQSSNNRFNKQKSMLVQGFVETCSACKI